MVRRMLLSRQVADELRNMIIRGEYKTGDRLPPIQTMAQSFQVSVSSMRESLRALELAGLLNVKHGKGVFVSDRISFSDDSVSTMLATDTLKLRTVYEARMIVEVGALPLIVERATDAQISHLRDLVDHLDLSAPASSISKADLEFHTALIEASGNPLLREMLTPWRAPSPGHPVPSLAAQRAGRVQRMARAYRGGAGSAGLRSLPAGHAGTPGTRPGDPDKRPHLRRHLNPNRRKEKLWPGGRRQRSRVTGPDREELRAAYGVFRPRSRSPARTPNQGYPLLALGMGSSSQPSLFPERQAVRHLLVRRAA